MLFRLQTTIVLMLLMYLYSALSKIFPGFVSDKVYNEEIDRFIGKVKTNFSLELSRDDAKAIVTVAGVWEMVGVMLVLYGIAMKDKGLSQVYYGSLALIFFTVAATIIFYAFENFKILPLLSNTTATAALLLIYPAAVDKFIDKNSAFHKKPVLFF